MMKKHKKCAGRMCYHGKTICGDRSNERKYICTLKDGHSGPHVACSWEHSIHEWETKMKPIQPTTPQKFTADDRRLAADTFRKHRKMFNDTHPIESKFGEILKKELKGNKNGK